jgi:hypothetical protein
VDFKLVIRKTFTVKGRSEVAKGFVQEEFWTYIETTENDHGKTERIYGSSKFGSGCIPGARVQQYQQQQRRDPWDS